ncbi:MAG TPA: hypothetical protein VGB18_07115, partial [Candidatus Thermoplasmatota archaeon]
MAGFKIELRDAEGRPVRVDEQAFAPSLLPLGGALEASVSTTDNVTGSLASYTFTMETANDFPVGGSLRVRIPGNFTLDDLDSSVAATIPGTFTAVADGPQQVIISRAGGSLVPSGVPFSVTVSGIRNPPVAEDPAPATIATRDAAGADLDVDEIDWPAITGDSLDVTISGAGRLAGSLDTYALTFTTAEPWEGLGRLVVKFPSGYSLETMEVQSFAGCSDALTLLTIGTTAILGRQSDGECPAGEKILVLSKILNPKRSGVPGDWEVEVQGAAGKAFASTGPTPGPSMLPRNGFLDGFSIVMGDAESGISGTSDANYVVNFTANTILPSGGLISFVLPSGFGVSAATAGIVVPTACDDFIVQTVAPTEVRIMVNEACPAGFYSVAVENISNPAAAQVYSPFAVSTQNQTGVDLEAGSGSIELLPATLVLQSPARFAGSATVGEVAAYQVRFFTGLDLPADGSIIVTVPDGFKLDDASVHAWIGCNVPISSLTTVTGNTLSAQLEGGPTDPACEPSATEPKTLIVAGVRNAGRSGSEHKWGVETRTASGQVMERSALVLGPALTMRGGGLSNVKLTVADPLVGARSDVEINFTASTGWGKAGSFEVFAPDGFSWSQPSAENTAPGACSGTLSAQAAGRTVKITRVSLLDCPLGQHTIRVAGLVNGPASGTSAAFHVATQNADGYDVDAATGATVVLVPAFTLAELTTSDPKPGSTATYSVTFQSPAAWPQNGTLLIGFPTGFRITDANLDASQNQLCTGATAQEVSVPSLAPNFFAIQLLGKSCAAEATYSVNVTGVVN